MSNDSNEKDKVNGQFQYYRSNIITLAGVIIALSSTVLGLILERNIPHLINKELTARIFWFGAILFVFVSVIFSLMTIYFVLKGYYLQANHDIRQHLGNPTPYFDKADKCILIALVLFLIGFVMGFIILAIQYFQNIK